MLLIKPLTNLNTLGNNYYAVSGYHIGKVVGDGIGAIAGAIETTFGGRMTTGGAVATSTGVGSPAGVPLMVQGAAVYSHGIAGIKV